eukprot:GFUD01005323.1.p1 GENE.GFUD01005323.1~~GFUD01005323.1.p1  ORF type:complete len:601 (+),score=163.41 GFUD01005323.1:149-1951(+)
MKWGKIALFLCFLNLCYGEDQCGVNARLDPALSIFFIVRGLPEESSGVWPWIVSVQQSEADDSWTHQCGGSLITLSTVLTAAHCPLIMVQRRERNMKVVAGDNHLKNNSDNAGRQEALVADYHIHPDYKWTISHDYNYDVAILVLARPLALTEYVRTVCLPPAPFPSSQEDDRAMVVAGWGKDEHGEHGNDLRTTTLVSLPQEYCNRSYEYIGFTGLPNGFTEDLLCAMDPTLAAGTCQGDSGSPLVKLDLASRQYVQHGVVSGSGRARCGADRYPNVFVRTGSTSVWNWIKNNMGHSDSDKEIVTDRTAQLSPDLLFLADRTVQLPNFLTGTSCSLPPYPLTGTKENRTGLDFRYAVTGIVSGEVMTCGGHDEDDAYRTSCYSLQAGVWTKQPSMQEYRSAAGVSSTPAGLLVTGGYSGAMLSSAEYFSSGQWLTGPALPVGLVAHCQVTAASGVIVTGGQAHGSLSLASVYILQDGVWRSLPPMQQSRRYHSCEVWRGELVVMGGENSAADKSMEIFNFSSQQWRRGPTLSSRFSFGQAVVFRDTLFVLYRGGSVYKLDTEDQSWQNIGTQIGNIGFRPVFPALLVTPAMMGCSDEEK